MEQPCHAALSVHTQKHLPKTDATMLTGLRILGTVQTKVKEGVQVVRSALSSPWPVPGPVCNDN